MNAEVTQGRPRPVLARSSNALRLAVIGNFLRSLYLSLTANRLGPEGLKAVHDTAGWSVLVFTAAGVVVLAWWFTRKEESLRKSSEVSDDPV